MKALFVTPIPDDRRSLFEDCDVEIRYMDRQKVTAADLEGIDLVLGNLPVDLLNQGKSLKWVQLDSAGADRYTSLRKDILLTNASGAYDTAISEHMLACTLAVTKKLYLYEEQQKEHLWNNLGSVPVISNLNVLSIGMGNIGTAYAKTMHTLGAHVSGVRRTVHDVPDYVDAMYTMDQLDEILPQFDVVALSLPGTVETVGLFDEARLRKMKKGAILLNVGRGSAIVTKDLVKIMKEEYLSAACLDVMDPEPLPKNSELWHTEHVYVTPHISGRFNAEVTFDKVLEIFHTNMLHYIHQEELEHIVDTSIGY